jgi:rhodanese-related sulfurtransferase
VAVADTAQVQKLIAGGAQVVEVLPEEKFRSEHLPGAVNFPLTRLSRAAAAELDPQVPTVVYCFDNQCDLSARAAALLEAYGFTDVYDYKASKAAWFAMGLPSEGSVAPGARAGGLARPAVTCAPQTPLSDLPAAGPGGVVIVTNEDDVVLGALRSEPSRSDSITASDVMQPGPPTVRPSITADELARSMDRAGQSHVIVTTLEGRLLGIIERHDLDVDR